MTWTVHVYDFTVFTFFPSSLLHVAAIHGYFVLIAAPTRTQQASHRKCSTILLQYIYSTNTYIILWCKVFHNDYVRRLLRPLFFFFFFPLDTIILLLCCFFFLFVTVNVSHTEVRFIIIIIIINVYFFHPHARPRPYGRTKCSGRARGVARPLEVQCAPALKSPFESPSFSETNARC